MKKRRSLLDAQEVCIEYDVYVCLDCSDPGCGNSIDDKFEGIQGLWTEKDLIEYIQDSDWFVKGGKIFCGDHKED